MAWTKRDGARGVIVSEGATRLTLGEGRWVGGEGPGRSAPAVRLRVEVGEDGCLLGGAVRNDSPAPVRLERYELPLREVVLANRPGRWRFFANGYQSWTQSRSFGPDEAQRVPNLHFARLMQDNLHNLASGREGEHHAEMFGVLGLLAPEEGAATDDQAPPRFLLVGQAAPFAHFVYVRVRFTPAPRVALVWDFGGKEIAAGDEVPLDPVRIRRDTQPNRLLDAYFQEIRALEREPEELPVGWCSWYFYFTRVSAADVLENLDEAVRRGVTWQLFQLDDGYQTAVGDWLSLRDRFVDRYPDGLRPLVERIEAAGMKAGIWFAPFSARANARVFQEHPDWFLKDDEGRPASVGWNPLWGIGGRFYGLDPTHPEARAHLREVVRTFVHDWGFRYLKLDFLYSACIYAHAHDPSLSPAERLQLGYRVIREAAGTDVFLLGCGAPLSASVGHIDGMRIGPDVAPFWFPTLRYHLTRDPHALSAKFAIRSTLTRAQMHRRLWQNDPDCLLIRDTRTKLDDHERATLTNAIVISGGMFLLSDRLVRLSDESWQRLRRVEELARACAEGRCWPLDLMEREMPELVYNTAGYLAVFHFGDRPTDKLVARRGALAELVPAEATLCSVWDERRFGFGDDGVLRLGRMAPHSSLLLEVVQGVTRA